MDVVDFLKSVGGVTVPADVIEQARQNKKEEEERKKKAHEAKVGPREEPPQGN